MGSCSRQDLCVMQECWREYKAFVFIVSICQEAVGETNRMDRSTKCFPNVMGTFSAVVYSTWKGEEFNSITIKDCNDWRCLWFVDWEKQQNLWAQEQNAGKNIAKEKAYVTIARASSSVTKVVSQWKFWAIVSSVVGSLEFVWDQSMLC